uniref:Uncharacterized protein n=1 Tax=Octopus bimaculoides TaxID=37653 RepID=A0A0L8H4I2_OCTBM
MSPNPVVTRRTTMNTTEKTKMMTLTTTTTTSTTIPRKSCSTAVFYASTVANDVDRRRIHLHFHQLKDKIRLATLIQPTTTVPLLLV